MCLYETQVINKRYTKTKKNGGNIPPMLDERLKYLNASCGRCIECKKKNARAWQARLLEHIKHHNNGKFITLTFSNESIYKLSKKIQNRTGYELDNEIATRATRKFLENWRAKYKKSLQHWFITELGHNGTENVHIHGIIWTNKSIEEVAKKWIYGFVWKGHLKNGKYENYVNEKTINYIVKYVNKIDIKHPLYKSKILTSPGIGNQYKDSYNAQRNKYNGTKTKESYKTKSGHEINLPTYWRNKLYTDEQKEQLWINKLNKGEKWIMGEKINTNNHEEEQKLLEYYRKFNNQHGYGSNLRDKEQLSNENLKRHELNMQRIHKGRHKWNKKKHASL